MSKKYKYRNPEGGYFIRFAVKNWVDVFTRYEYKNILIVNFECCQQRKGLELFTWYIKTNHVH